MAYGKVRLCSKGFLSAMTSIKTEFVECMTNCCLVHSLMRLRELYLSIDTFSFLAFYLLSLFILSEQMGSDVLSELLYFKTYFSFSTALFQTCLLMPFVLWCTLTNLRSLKRTAIFMFQGCKPCRVFYLQFQLERQWRKLLNIKNEHTVSNCLFQSTIKTSLHRISPPFLISILKSYKGERFADGQMKTPLLRPTVN